MVSCSPAGPFRSVQWVGAQRRNRRDMPNTTDGIIFSHLSKIRLECQTDGLDFQIMGVALYGSRMKGTHRSGNDLDVLVEYVGNAREDDMFNALNRQALFINGIRVDFNPIKKCKSGTIDSFAHCAVRIPL